MTLSAESAEAVDAVSAWMSEYVLSGWQEEAQAALGVLAQRLQAAEEKLAALEAGVYDSPEGLVRPGGDPESALLSADEAV